MKKDEKITEVKINVPDGFEIDKENSTFECIKFKPRKKNLPKTWEEFCETHLIGTDECFIGSSSNIAERYGYGDKRMVREDRNILPNKETAEAFLALMQLIQLRDCYNEGYKPDWKKLSEVKYCIVARDDKLTTYVCNAIPHVLAFKTEELRNQFLENFRDLIEIAKPLI